jgi:hypothetical protein
VSPLQNNEGQFSAVIFQVQNELSFTSTFIYTVVMWWTGGLIFKKVKQSHYRPGQALRVPGG